jgi:hypothetical protein
MESKKIKPLLEIDSFPGDLCGFSMREFKIGFFATI